MRVLAAVLIGMATMMQPGAAQQPDLKLVPRPKQVTAGGKPFVLRDGVTWTVTCPAGETRVSDALGRLLATHALQSSGRRLKSQDNSTRVRIGNPKPEGAAGDWWKSTEGYLLRTDENGIVISAPQPAGAFYAIQTLAQLLRGRECPGVRIADWPSMRFRGAHWFPSASGVPFHRKLIERVMARYKLNRAVVQCEAARWDSHPEIADPNSISKKDLAGLVQLCRREFIEPIPLVNVPGHAQWMFRNGQHLDLAEDPSVPYAYCVSNPDADRFVKQILTEAEEVFKPHAFHLGHDEVTIRGRFPNPECPRCRGKSATDLVMHNADRLSDWLKPKHQRMIVWGDMFLAREEGIIDAHAPDAREARRRRQALPPGVVVADWQYGATDRYPSLDLFRQAGIETIACTWWGPENIYRFSQAALKNGSMGLLQTTWCGYFQDEKVLRSESRQFSAFILAAEYAWSGRADPPAALGYDPAAEFQARWRE